MIESATLHAFDELVNPILLCEVWGKVLFKNKAAVREIPLPKTGGSLCAYLSKEYRALFSSAFPKESFPLFPELSVEGKFRRAFADPVAYNGRTAILLVFSPLFLHEITLPLWKTGGKELAALARAEEIVRMANHLSRTDKILEAGRDFPLHRDMTTLFYRLVDHTLQEVAYGKEQFYFRLDRTIRTLSYACDSVLFRWGWDVIFEADLADLSLCFVEFKPFVLLVSLLVLFMAEFSRAPTLTVSLERTDSGSLWLLFSAPQNRALRIPRGKSGKLAELLPGRSIDLYFFDKLFCTDRYRFDFSLSQNPQTPMKLRFSAPIFPARHLREYEELDLPSLLTGIDRILCRLMAEQRADPLQ